LEEKLSKYCILTISVKADLKKAKKMEKEQIINAYEVGITRGMSYDEDIYHKKNWSSSEQYYNETFKSK
jgi:hypothetical protein